MVILDKKEYRKVDEKEIEKAVAKVKLNFKKN